MSTILRPFGRTGLMVSPVTLDTREFGSKVDEAEAGKLFAQALDAGVNVFDTANVYASGKKRGDPGTADRIDARAADRRLRPRNYGSVVH
jgi:1-deoxyxylulose-5-phosphate synthase